VIGAGLAGALLAAVLARQGVSVAVVDPCPFYRSDFRCEKLSIDQIALLAELGLLDAVQSALGVSLRERGFRYEQLVNAVRATWPESVRLIAGRVSAIVPDGERQIIRSSEGELARVRLAVLATGVSPNLSSKLGLGRKLVRERHSLCIGFNLTSPGGFGFDGLVHPGECAGDKVAFVSLFPVADAMRVNLFSYHDPRDGWVAKARRDPMAALHEAAPRLMPKLGGTAVDGPVELRVTDIYRAEGHLRPGLVLIGDAFQTSCPATALGVTRILTEVRQLTRTHLPKWLSTPGMGTDKISEFYADPVRIRLDRKALGKAKTGRSAAVETTWAWKLYRAAVASRRRLSRR
jgi:2-polyprenyl-6-methoxyphenol hydroxylase-like FAD-dependent oxidoreductase